MSNFILVSWAGTTKDVQPYVLNLDNVVGFYPSIFTKNAVVRMIDGAELKLATSFEDLATLVDRR
jgi:hypothetical protein